ncbi:hypothetical protein D3C86_1831810 [compost metagenome]
MKMERPSKNSMKNSASTNGTRTLAAKSILARPRYEVSAMNNTVQDIQPMSTPNVCRVRFV